MLHIIWLLCATTELYFWSSYHILVVRCIVLKHAYLVVTLWVQAVVVFPVLICTVNVTAVLAA